MNDKPSVMKTVIIEDEKAAVRNLTSLLNEVKPEAEIIAILDSINSTIEWFGIHPMPELVFMDIHLADGSAFEIFDHISITCPIIFTTAYDEYALRDAFEQNARSAEYDKICKKQFIFALVLFRTVFFR